VTSGGGGQIVREKEQFIGSYGPQVSWQIPLFGRVEASVHDAVTALVQGDEEKARAVIAGDAKIDGLLVEVERAALRTIALRMPVAGDLRDVLAGLKSSMLIARIGDCSKNIAHRVPLVNACRSCEHVKLVAAMEEALHDVGAGSGGLSVASGAAQLGLKVVLFERGEMGGDCLNYGCVPSKAIIAAGKAAQMVGEELSSLPFGGAIRARFGRAAHRFSRRGLRKTAAAPRK